MKRYKKKELLQSVSTLIKANDTIVKAMKANPGSVAEVFASCQESAILIGSYIESLDEKYTCLVRLLEDYCENIYQMSEAVPDEIQCRKIAKKIQKQLNQLKNGVTYDLPDDRKEVVFLPYKASMWDSLESVWKAADADESCDAYVVPIPYYSKNPDGSFREMHYEGDQYPSYVPVTKYDEYNFEERMPDEIYIHNGYDAYNIVTSVHPFFYSDNLKKYTDCLVYIPYFVLAEPDPENDDVVKGISHFCTVPAVFHADRVIVQSEAMKKVYVKALMDVMEDHSSAAKKYWEDKIEGTGSPKFDKVAGTKREDVEIPTEWLRIINKPDGTPKKIIFYNNSISALLQHNEKMIAKMESVFKIFKENKDDVALLWRPHPLIESTLTAMRPQLWEQYKEIRDKYIEEGWGIYDDTADLDRAIVVSDAYYGDGSSVVQLYQKTGKPVMVQNADSTIIRKIGNILLPGASVINHDRMYFSILNGNGLFCYDFSAKQLEFLGRFQGEDFHDSYLHCDAVKYEKYLIFAPYNAKNMAVYDMEEKKIYSYDVFKDAPSKTQIIKIFIYKDSIFLMGNWGSPDIIKIDLTTQKKEFFYDWYEKEDIAGSFLRNTSFDRMYIKGNKVYAPVLFSHYMVIFDLDAQSVEVVSLPLSSDDAYCAAIAVENGALWVAECRNRIVKYDCSNFRNLKVETEHGNFPKCFHYIDDSPNTFIRVANMDGFLYFVPGRASHFIKIDLQKDTMALVQLEGEDDPYYGYGKYVEKYLWPILGGDKDKIYIFHKTEGTLHIIDLINNNLEKTVFYDKWGISDLLLHDHEGIYREGVSALNSLRNLIDMIACKKKIKAK